MRSMPNRSLKSMSILIPWTRLPTAAHGSKNQTFNDPAVIGRYEVAADYILANCQTPKCFLLALAMEVDIYLTNHPPSGGVSPIFTGRVGLSAVSSPWNQIRGESHLRRLTRQFSRLAANAQRHLRTIFWLPTIRPMPT